MTNKLNTAFKNDITVVLNLENREQVMNASSIWIDLRSNETQFSTIDKDNLKSFINTGRKVVMVGENSNFRKWNLSILSVTGGKYIGNASSSSQPITPLIKHNLTHLIEQISFGGSAWGVVDGGTQVFSEHNTITLWGASLNILTIFDTNPLWSNDFDTPQFRINIASWLSQSLECNIEDSDNDGVIDQWDNCPETPLNSYVNSTGCPLITGNSAISGRILMNNQPLTHGSATLIQSGELFQKSILDKNGCYKFEKVAEEKSINVMIRRPAK